jgi:hypothetical protein
MQLSRSAVFAFVTLAACSPKASQPLGTTSQVTPASNLNVQSQATATIASLASTGPFGLEMGMTILQLQKLGPVVREDDHYRITVPLPNSRFAHYAAVLSRQTGLCKIVALTAPIPTNVFGEGLRLEFNNLQQALENKYGGGEIVQDYLKSGSIWREPGEFMTGLRKDERKLQAFWVDKSVATTVPGKQFSLPNALSAIAITAATSNGDQGYLTLTYQFSNYVSCEAAIAKEKDGSL